MPLSYTKHRSLNRVETRHSLSELRSDAVNDHDTNVKRYQMKLAFRSAPSVSPCATDAVFLVQIADLLDYLASFLQVAIPSGLARSHATRRVRA